MAVSVFFSMEGGKDVLTRLKRCTVSFKKSTDKFGKMYCLVGEDILTRLGFLSTFTTPTRKVLPLCGVHEGGAPFVDVDDPDQQCPSQDTSGG